MPAMLTHASRRARPCSVSRREVADQRRRHGRQCRGEHAPEDASGVNCSETLDERKNQHGCAKTDQSDKQHATRAALIR